MRGFKIIVSGMAVHNLRDMQWGLQGVKPYMKSFDEALREAVEIEEELKRVEKLEQLLKSRMLDLRIRVLNIYCRFILVRARRGVIRGRGFGL
jgi:hypothetical protein